MGRAPTGEWLGSPGAADYLGLNQRTVYKLVDEGEIPAYKLGRVYRFKRADLDAYLAHARLQPGDMRHLRPKGAPATGGI